MVDNLGENLGKDIKVLDIEDLADVLAGKETRTGTNEGDSVSSDLVTIYSMFGTLIGYYHGTDEISQEVLRDMVRISHVEALSGKVSSYCACC
jgi:hypothetical protein